MRVTQSIEHPYGVAVFGSALIRVEPDVAQVTFSALQLNVHPRQAFQSVRNDAQAIQAFLQSAQIEEVQSSRIQLLPRYHYKSGEQQFIGYGAEITYNLLLTDLGRIEEILVGLVDAGTERIVSVTYQTTRLKELRAEARRRAVAAAREKAELYCEAAGVQLGKVLHIEDVDPTQLRSFEGHSVREVQPDDVGPLQAFNPGSIVIQGAVMIGYGFAD